MSSSYQNKAELELGLGLSLRCGGGGGYGGGGVVKAKESPPWGEHEYVKIMTAKEFPSAAAGTKRGADCVGPQEVGYSASPVSVTSQIVGWPPIRTHRMNTLINQTKSANDDNEDKGVSKNNTSKGILTHGRNNNDGALKERGYLGFVKVNMDGLPIGRKVDLSVHACYETLAQTIEEMFFKPSTAIKSIRPGGVKKHTVQPSKLLDGSSEFVLTYEDKEGDWMLVGDVPWGMFLSTAKRLRIMKTSEANGLAPRLQQRNDRQKTKPI